MPPVTKESVEKSKKKKKKLEDLNESTEVRSEVLNTEQTPTTDNLKKKKRKSKDVVENEIVSESSKGNVENNVEISKKKRKTENIAENGQLQTDCNQVNTMESKKRKLKESTIENEIPKEKMKDEINQDEHQKQQDSDTSFAFCFKERILAIMSSKKNISVDKLQKKVLNTYQKVTGIEPNAKVIKKFRKHLKKISNVEVTDGSVKLIDS